MFTLESVLRLAVDIAKGMVFIHSRNVTHGDLKSRIFTRSVQLVAKLLIWRECRCGCLSDESGGGGTLGWNALRG